MPDENITIAINIGIAGGVGPIKPNSVKLDPKQTINRITNSLKFKNTLRGHKLLSNLV